MRKLLAYVLVWGWLAAIILLFASGLNTRSLPLAIAQIGVSLLLLLAAGVLIGGEETIRTVKTIKPLKREGWEPKTISVSKNEDGITVAIVEQHNGNLVTVEVPREIENALEARNYVLETLMSNAR